MLYRPNRQANLSISLMNCLFNFVILLTQQLISWAETSSHRSLLKSYMLRVFGAALKCHNCTSLFDLLLSHNKGIVRVLMC